MITTYLVGSAKLKSFVFRGVSARGLVGGDIRSGRNKFNGDSPSNTLHAGSKCSGSVDLSGWPAHDPQSINKCLGRKRTKLLKHLIRDVTTTGRTSGEGPHQSGSDDRGSAAEGRRKHRGGQSFVDEQPKVQTTPLGTS
jgi:hypothetical protein